MTNRLASLFIGLVLYGVSMAMMVRAGLGLDPWDVFHQGVSDRTGLSFGTVTALTGVVVLLIWIPLRQRPGFGTVANVVVIALAVDAALALVPTVEPLAARIAVMVAAVVTNAFATALYIGAGMGPGPRDGLMTGFVARTGGSLRLVRTAIEVTVLAVGWLLGGSVGIGTVVYALGIGPLVHLFSAMIEGSHRNARTTEPATVTVEPGATAV
ncbi:YczE/YyaS/YitT family protein [Actinomycetes bacterium M1A6_2h]